MNTFEIIFSIQFLLLSSQLFYSQVNCQDENINQQINKTSVSSVNITDHPYHVLIKTKSYNSDFVDTCEGTIIGEKWIITAAHCVVKTYFPRKIDQVRVVVATDDLESEIDEENVFNISSIHIHPEASVMFADAPYTRNDIALLELKNPLNFGTKVGQVTLPQKGSQLDKEKSFDVVGYGVDRRISMYIPIKVNPDYTKKLEQNSVKILPDSACEESYSGSYHQNFKCVTFSTKNKLCQGGPGTGNGLVGKEDGKFVLFGVSVISYGQCGDENSAHIYTFIPPYVDWIKSVISKKTINKQS